MSREALLARTFVDLADTLVDDFDVVEVLTRVVDGCVEVLDVASAGIMLVGPDGDLRVMSSSSVAMRALELFEVQAHEGPCLDCFTTGEPVLHQDLATAGARWPEFAAEALEKGFRSVQALPMRLRGTVLGALNLFHTDPREMPEQDVVVAQALADIATIAILQHAAAFESHALNEQLQQALNSRIIIEQAKGVVAERTGLGMDEAFAQLRHDARSRNLRLVDVARAVIEA